MRRFVTFGTLEVVKRWALVTARPRATPSARPVLPFVALAVGLCLIGQVLAADPVGYGVPVWPFADAVDRAENEVMRSVVSAARRSRDLASVPSTVVAGDVDVLDTKSDDGNVWMRLRLHLPTAGFRCREVVIRGAQPVEVNSKRVTC
jgi:hypothetical protein